VRFQFTKELIFSVAVLASATILAAMGRITAEQYLGVITMLMSFLAGVGYGYKKALKKLRNP